MPRSSPSGPGIPLSLMCKGSEGVDEERGLGDKVFRILGVEAWRNGGL